MVQGKTINHARLCISERLEERNLNTLTINDKSLRYGYAKYSELFTTQYTHE
jgi:hypothetical protein